MVHSQQIGLVLALTLVILLVYHIGTAWLKRIRLQAPLRCINVTDVPVQQLFIAIGSSDAFCT